MNPASNAVLAGSTSALGVHPGQDWSTATNDVDSWSRNCAVHFGVPWYYTDCWNAIPVSGGSYPTGPRAPGQDLASYAIYARETSTPAAVPEPGTALLLLGGLGGLAARRGPRHRQAAGSGASPAA